MHNTVINTITKYSDIAFWALKVEIDYKGHEKEADSDL